MQEKLNNPDGKKPTAPDEKKVEVSPWKNVGKTTRRTFPGPRGATAFLRVAMERAAYAELIGHAKESLDKEICGVLAGTICEDDEGLFVHVAAVIRGAAASRGSTHVTFTQQTWTAIHATLDRDYPKLQIVGWYHSHPGFGVQFSDMDLFIQRNFFTGPTQVALVIDPLSGAVAICLNSPEGIRHLERYWVDGREQPAQVPKESQPAQVASGQQVSGTGDEALRALDARISQLVQALDEQRASHHRLALFTGMLLAMGLIFGVGYSIYSSFRYRNEPPTLNQFVPVPIQIGDKSVMLGVGVVEWKVPEELNAALVQLERAKRQALEDEAKKALEAKEKQNATNHPTTKP